MTRADTLRAMRLAAAGSLAATAAGLALVAAGSQGASATELDESSTPTVVVGDPLPEQVSRNAVPGPPPLLDPDDCPACGLG